MAANAAKFFQSRKNLQNLPKINDAVPVAGCRWIRFAVPRTRKFWKSKFRPTVANFVDGATCAPATVTSQDYHRTHATKAHSERNPWHPLLGKFLFQRPLSRILAELGANHNLNVSSCTVTDGLKKIAHLFTPLYEAIADRNIR
jgi:hypothetical protein